MHTDNLLSSKVIVKNTLWNAYGRVFSMLSGLIISYFIIKKLGISSYGVYGLVSAIGGYLFLLDFGINSSFIRYISTYAAVDRKEDIRKIVNTGVLFYCLFAIFVFVIAYFLSDFIITFLKVESDLKSEVKLIILIYIASLSIFNIFYPYQAIFPSLHRFDIHNKLIIGISIINLITTIILVKYGLVAIALGNLIVVLFSSILYKFLSLRLLPYTRFRILDFDKKLFKTIFRFGYKVQLINLSSIMVVHFEKLVITRFINFSTVGFYQIASSICEYSKILPLLLSSTLLVVFSSLNAKKELDKLRKGYLKSLKYIFFVSAPIFLFIFLSSKLIIFIYLGVEYNIASRITDILSIGYLFNVGLGPSTGALLYAIERVDIQLKGVIIYITLVFISSIFFIYIFSYNGVAIGNSISLIISVLYSVAMTIRLLKINLYEFASNLKDIFIASTISFFISLAFERYFFNELSTRYMAVVELFSVFLIYFITYFIILVILKPFDSDDLSVISKINKRILIFAKYLTKDGYAQNI